MLSKTSMTPTKVIQTKERHFREGRVERGCPKSDTPTLLLLLHPSPPCSAPCVLGQRRSSTCPLLPGVTLTVTNRNPDSKWKAGSEKDIREGTSRYSSCGVTLGCQVLCSLREGHPSSQDGLPEVSSQETLSSSGFPPLFRPRGGYNFIVINPGRALAPPGAVYRVSVTP